jgi:luciferase family oxidoreductase group 1
MNDLSLSILDFQHPGASVALACAADEWGFKRYWLGEHHGSNQCANPLLLGALLAGATSRIRLGTGGVSLTYRSPLQVAEDARLIEFMMPGRFDLGITRGLQEAGPVAAELLDGRVPLSGGGYAGKVRALQGLVTGRIDAGHPLAGTAPYLEDGPPLWLLGLSLESARLAGSLGIGFCFSLHHGGSKIDGPAVARAYRDGFIPSPELAEPAALVVVRCVCAGTEAEAIDLETRCGPPPVPGNPTLLGSARQCADRIAGIAADFATDEVMILDTLGEDQDARLEMYRRLSEEFDLPAAGGLPD